MLNECWDFDQWRDQFGPQIVIGQAWCEIMTT